MNIYFEIKRIYDFLLSLSVIVLACPLFIIIAISIKLDSKGPIIFKQRRIGKNKRVFDIYKFRTMQIDTPKDLPTHMLSNSDLFITKVGRLLRKTSLDELPQLFNILKGEMSIVGPRPALWNQFDLIMERDKYGANDIRPGLTGWAQVNGRDELPIIVKSELDGYYVKNSSFILDLKIFIMTVINVVTAKGIVEGIHSNDKNLEL